MLALAGLRDAKTHWAAHGRMFVEIAATSLGGSRWRGLMPSPSNGCYASIQAGLPNSFGDAPSQAPEALRSVDALLLNHAWAIASSVHEGASIESRHSAVSAGLNLPYAASAAVAGGRLWCAPVSQGLLTELGDHAQATPGACRAGGISGQNHEDHKKGGQTHEDPSREGRAGDTGSYPACR